MAWTGGLRSCLLDGFFRADLDWLLVRPNTRPGRPCIRPHGRARRGALQRGLPQGLREAFAARLPREARFPAPSTAQDGAVNSARQAAWSLPSIPATEGPPLPAPRGGPRGDCWWGRRCYSSRSGVKQDDSATSALKPPAAPSSPPPPALCSDLLSLSRARSPLIQTHSPLLCGVGLW